MRFARCHGAELSHSIAATCTMTCPCPLLHGACRRAPGGAPSPLLALAAQPSSSSVVGAAGVASGAPVTPAPPSSSGVRLSLADFMASKGTPSPAVAKSSPVVVKPQPPGAAPGPAWGGAQAPPSGASPTLGASVLSAPGPSLKDIQAEQERQRARAAVPAARAAAAGTGGGGGGAASAGASVPVILPPGGGGSVFASMSALGSSPPASKW